MELFIKMFGLLAGRLTRFRLKAELDGQSMDFSGDLKDQPKEEFMAKVEEPKKGGLLKAIAAVATMVLSAWGGAEWNEARNLAITKAKVEARIEARQRIQQKFKIRQQMILKVHQLQAGKKTCVDKAVLEERSRALKALFEVRAKYRQMIRKQRKKLKLNSHEQALVEALRKQASDKQLKWVLGNVFGVERIERMYRKVVIKKRYVYSRRCKKSRLLKLARKLAQQKKAKKAKGKKDCKKKKKSCPPCPNCDRRLRKAQPAPQPRNRRNLPPTVLVKKKQ